MLPIIELQRSEISPVVRQLLPTLAAHKAGLSTPHSIYISYKILNKNELLNYKHTTHRKEDRSSASI